MSKYENIPGYIEDEFIQTTGNNAITLYNKGYYGFPNEKGVKLNGFETLHLLELDRIVVEDNGNRLTSQQISKYFSKKIDNFMIRYQVYKDLRNRGYIVNLGVGSSFFFRLYERAATPNKDGAKYYVIPLKEGGFIPLTDMRELIQISKESKKILVVGMLDTVGDVSYLKVSETKLKNIAHTKRFVNTHGFKWEKSMIDYENW